MLDISKLKVLLNNTKLQKDNAALYQLIAQLIRALEQQEDDTTELGVSVINVTTALTGTGLTNINVSAGTTSNLLSALTFNNSNGVTFGLNASTITASINALTSQSNQAFSADGGSSTFQTLSFTNTNGISFTNTNGSVGAIYVPFSGGNSNLGNTAGDTGVVTGRLVLVGTNNITLSGSTNAGSMTISISGPTPGAGTINISAGTTSNNLASVVFSNSNNVSFGLDGSTITATATFAGGISNINVSAGTTSNLLSALTFDNSNGITFGLNASTITASHNGITSQTNQTLGLFMSSNTTSSVSSGTVDARSMTFRGMGVASVGYSAGEVVISVPSGGGGLTNINVSAGTTSNNLSNIVFSNSNNVSFGLNGSTITATATVATSLSNINVSAGTTSNNLSNVVFSNSNGVTFGLNGSTVTASVNTAGGAEVTLKDFDPFRYALISTSFHGHGTVFVQPASFPARVEHNMVAIPVFYTQAANSTLTVSMSIHLGLYTRTSNSLSILQSQSSLITINGSGTASSSANSGYRLATFGWTSTVTPGNYWVGLLSLTSTSGNNASLRMWYLSRINTHFSGLLGVGSNISNQYDLGLGTYRTSTTALPNAIGFADLGGTESNVLRPPVYRFMETTF